jgi:hypothetical protein
MLRKMMIALAAITFEGAMVATSTADARGFGGGGFRGGGFRGGFGGGFRGAGFRSGFVGPGRRASAVMRGAQHAAPSVPHAGRVHHAPGAASPAHAPRHGPRVAAPCGAICELG